MKISSEPDDFTRECHEKINAILSVEDRTSLLTTLLGLACLLAERQMEKGIDSMTYQEKYAIIQVASVRELFRKIITDELTLQNKGNAKFSHMPMGNGAWESERDFEERFVFVVKAFYEQLKKDGKI